MSFFIVFLLLFAASSQSRTRTHTHQLCLFVCLFFFLWISFVSISKGELFLFKREKKNRPQCHRLVYTYSSSRSSFSFNDIHSRPCHLCVCVHFQLDPLFFLFNLYENYIAFFFVNLIQIVVVFFSFSKRRRRKNKFEWGLTHFFLSFLNVFSKKNLQKFNIFKNTMYVLFGEAMRNNLIFINLMCELFNRAGY